MTTNDDERVQLTPDDWQKSAIHRAFGRWTAANGTPEAETAGSTSPSRAVQREREGGKVQARLVGTDAHVLGTERLLQCILGHLGQHLGHHLNFAQLLAVDASLLSKEGSRQQQGARAERRYYTSTYCTLLPLSLVYGIYPLTFLWCAV